MTIKLSQKIANINMPEASLTKVGYVSTGTQSFAGEKTFANMLTVSTAAKENTNFFCTGADRSEIYVGRARSSDESLVIGYNRAGDYGYIGVFGENDTDALVIGNGGNIGIGTGSPNYPLHIVKDLGGQQAAVIKNASTNSAAAAAWIASNGTNEIRLLRAGTNYSAYGSFTSNDGALYSDHSIVIMSDNAAGIIKFATGGSGEKMRIDPSGNVGIGTSSPGYKLEVNGDIKVDGINLGEDTLSVYEEETYSGTVDGITFYYNFIRVGNRVDCSIQCAGTISTSGSVLAYAIGGLQFAPQPSIVCTSPILMIQEGGTLKQGYFIIFNAGSTTRVDFRKSDHSNFINGSALIMGANTNNDCVSFSYIINNHQSY